jgi:hypothetical protein
MSSNLLNNRYMGVPDENRDGYCSASVVELARHFPDEEGRLLIVHGMADENVHFFHTATLINALVVGDVLLPSWFPCLRGPRTIVVHSPSRC